MNGNEQINKRNNSIALHCYLKWLVALEKAGCTSSVVR